MRHYPDLTDEYDREDLADFPHEPWQLEALRLNPDYCGWGPHEDYMWNKHEGWDAPVTIQTWPEFKWKLDDLNECANFYFALDRDMKTCEACAGKGHHPDAQWVSESWYVHSSPFARPDPHMEGIKEGMNRLFGSNLSDGVHGRASFPGKATLAKYGPEFRAFCEAMRDGGGEWCNQLTQDEVDALEAEGRLRDLTHDFDPAKEGAARWTPNGRKATAAEVNAHGDGRGSFHDAINRGICIRARIKRLGLPANCPVCEGQGSLFTEAKARLTLTLWWMHPRKGCSRGLEVREIRQEDLPAALALLAEAAERNAARFQKAVWAAKKAKPVEAAR